MIVMAGASGPRDPHDRTLKTSGKLAYGGVA